MSSKNLVSNYLEDESTKSLIIGTDDFSFSNEDNDEFKNVFQKVVDEKVVILRNMFPENISIQSVYDIAPEDSSNYLSFSIKETSNVELFIESLSNFVSERQPFNCRLIKNNNDDIDITISTNKNHPNKVIVIRHLLSFFKQLFNEKIIDKEDLNYLRKTIDIGSHPEKEKDLSNIYSCYTELFHDNDAFVELAKKLNLNIVSIEQSDVTTYIFESSMSYKMLKMKLVDNINKYKKYVDMHRVYQTLEIGRNPNNCWFVTNNENIEYEVF